MRLKELTRRYSGDEIAVFVSPRMTNEEIYLAQKFARVACKTHNVTTCRHLVNRELDCPEVVSTASYAEVADAQAILVVNSNMEEENFVADLLVKRAIRKGGKLIFIGPEENRLSHFAEVSPPLRRGCAGRRSCAALATGGEGNGNVAKRRRRGRRRASAEARKVARPAASSRCSSSTRTTAARERRATSASSRRRRSARLRVCSPCARSRTCRGSRHGREPDLAARLHRSRRRGCRRGAARRNGAWSCATSSAPARRWPNSCGRRRSGSRSSSARIRSATKPSRAISAKGSPRPTSWSSATSS